MLAAAVLAIAPDAEARDPRVPKAFQKLHPCPSTGKRSGACPGYVRDHIVPLCRGGADSVGNMQWQTKSAAKAKDATECGRRR